MNILYKNESDIGSSIIGLIKERILKEKWCEPPLRIFIYNNFDLKASCVLFMVFSPQSRKPSLVVKLSRNRQAIKYEYDNLVLIQKKAPGIAPVPLFFEKMDSFGVFYMRAIQSYQISKWNKRVKIIPHVVDRLIYLHCNVKQENFTEQETTRRLLEPLNYFREISKDSKLSAAYDKIGKSILADLAGYCLPQIPQHSDIFFDNILIQDGKIFFLDWEDFGHVKVPGYDLFCFFLNFFHPHQENENINLFNEKLFESNMSSAIKEYFRALHIPVKFAYGLFVYTILQQYIYSYQLNRASVDLLWWRLSTFIDQPGQFYRFWERL